MKRPNLTLYTLVLLLVLVSAACSGFLAGRTIKLHQEGKMQELQHVSEQIVDVSTGVDRAVNAVKRIILR
ncbi:hypothetical protein [Lewinella sp. IMCC34191]|uniref:hypothetical protein n=1 Tax=Lewinella sp. IMCC34191 TaxID=2259172 RepID=UPI000E21C843|nr:hypothetical protein [Lewinella sp. IMCC34191]